MPNNRDLLSNRVAVITGASRGIGMAIARQLAHRKVRLVLAARDENRLKSLVRSWMKRAVVCATDIRSQDEVKSLVRTAIRAFGTVDILVNAAGILDTGWVENTDPNRAADVIDTNLMGMFRCCKEVIPLMKKRKRGQIVNIASIVGTKAQAGMAIYSASKFGVMGFSDALNLEVKPFGIRVSTIRPGTVVTDLWKGSWKTAKEAEFARKHLLRADDVARAVVFVLDQPKHVTIRDLLIHPNI